MKLFRLGLLFAVVLGFAAPAIAALPAKATMGVYTLTPSAKVATKHRDGDDGSAAIPLLWATIANISVYTNASGSINLCSTYLTQPGSPNADLAVSTGSLPSGWSLGGTNNCTLTWSTPSAASALIRVSATRSAFVALSNEFSVSSTAPPSGDTTAPTIPTGCVATNGTNQVTVECDASSDPYVGTAGAVTQYNFTHSVDGGSTLTAPSAGLSLPFTLYNIGTISSPGAPFVVQSGAQHTITAAGTGYVDGTTDQFAFNAAQVSGSASVAGILTSASGSATFRSVGLCIRGDASTNNAAMLALRQQPGNANVVQCRGRSTVGANKTTFGTGTIALPVQGRIRYDGATAVCETLSGNTWTSIASVSMPALGSAPFYGSCASSASAGVETTAVIGQVNLNNAARISKTISTTHAGTVTVTARDAVPNISSASTSVAVAPETGAPPAQAKKYHPGHYLWSTKKTFTASNLALMLADADTVCSTANLKGMQLTIFWGYLEGIPGGPSAGTDVKGDFSSGFSYLDQILDRLKCGANPDKSLMLNISDSIYSTVTLSDVQLYFPNYLLTSTYACGNGQNGVVYAPAGTTWTGSLGAVACMWLTPTMNALIDLRTGYAARYNSNAQFEMVSTAGETAIGASSSTGFSYSAFIPQLKRAMQATSDAWPNTTIRLPANFTDTDAHMNELFDLCESLPNCAVGGPDPELSLPGPGSQRPITANRLFRGLDTGTDRRATVGWIGEQQDLGITVKYFETPAEIQDYQKNVMRNRWMIWKINSGVMTQINADGSVYSTACPYDACTP